MPWPGELNPLQAVHAGLRRALICVLLYAGIVGATSLQALELPPPEGPEAYLVTYGPGEIYWQRFGHNAIWLREPGGLNHTFNYGFFDFEQESFLLRFVQGRMLYFAAMVPADREFALYASEGREIRVQRLDLDPDTYARLREHLVWNVQPENSEYLYDYYLDNCSTRIRDALDLALDGALAEQFRPISATQNFRSHTRRSTQSDRDYYLGLMAGLGMPVDRPISRWDEQFLPVVLADSLGDIEIGAGRPLVIEDRVLSAGTVPETPSKPGSSWPFYLAVSLGLLVMTAVLGKFFGPGPVNGLALAWMLLCGTLGLFLLAVWAFTDHVMAYPNLNLLLFQPLALMGLARRWRRFVAVLVLATLAGAAFVAGFTHIQYVADTLALFGPLNLALALWLLRQTSHGRQGDQ